MSGSYQESIARGLSEALARADTRTWNVEGARVVVLSDLHRGRRDHADDFRWAAATYRRALDHYLDAGYLLVLLGDVEELWEGWPRSVIPANRVLLDLEARFHASPEHGLVRIWGNHDDLWQYPHQVARHLGPIYGELRVSEALDVTVTRGTEELGRIFLVHGHQGTGPSDRWGGISRHFVRWVWRPIQRLFKIRRNTPATDFEINSKHDRAMYDWAAARNDLVLVAGHTHKPVFLSRPHVATLERVRDHLDSTSPDRDDAEGMDLVVDWARREAFPDAAGADLERDRLCYFNAGCGCFSNGDVTGIELVDGDVRLIRWGVDTVDPEDRVLETLPLADVFARLGH